MNIAINFSNSSVVSQPDVQTQKNSQHRDAEKANTSQRPDADPAKLGKPASRARTSPSLTVQQFNTLVGQIHVLDAQALEMAQSLQLNETEMFEAQEHNEVSLEEGEVAEKQGITKHKQTLSRVQGELARIKQGQKQLRNMRGEEGAKRRLENHALRNQVNVLGATLSNAEKTPEGAGAEQAMALNDLISPLDQGGPWDSFFEAIEKAEKELEGYSESAEGYADFYQRLVELMEYVANAMYIDSAGNVWFEPNAFRQMNDFLDRIMREYPDRADEIQALKDSVAAVGDKGGHMTGAQFNVWRASFDARIQRFQEKMEKAGQEYSNKYSRFENMHKTLSSIIQAEADMMKMFLQL